MFNFVPFQSTAFIVKGLNKSHKHSLLRFTYYPFRMLNVLIKWKWQLKDSERKVMFIFAVLKMYLCAIIPHNMEKPECYYSTTGHTSHLIIYQNNELWIWDYKHTENSDSSWSLIILHWIMHQAQLCAQFSVNGVWRCIGVKRPNTPNTIVPVTPSTLIYNNLFLPK